MVEVTENTINALEQLAEKQDEDFDEVVEDFKEKYQDVEERTEGLDDDYIEELALRQFRSQLTASNRIPSEHIQMLTIGGDVINTSNGDMFIGTAVVDEDPEDDSVQTVLGAVNIYDEDIASDIYDAFSQVGNVVSGEFNVSESGFRNHVEVANTDDTEFEVHKPDDRSELISEINEHVPETEIATIADNISAQTRSDDGDMYTVNSDLYRIRADVFDGYKNPDTGTGIYTLRDNSVFDEEDIADSPVFDAENANENATPGLTCFFDPNKMEWGSSSVVEFYGTVQKNDDGIINFSADGAVAILENEDGFDGYTDSEDESPDRSGGTETSVDRTQI